MAIYLFGSQAKGEANALSDVDIAVLVTGRLDPLRLWELSGELADIHDRLVDLLDLRSASTVMQYQIIIRGRRVWSAGVDAGIYEAFILSAKIELDAARGWLDRRYLRSGSDPWSMAFCSIKRLPSSAASPGREEYDKGPEMFSPDHTRQDAAILNIQRVCEAALDMGQHLIRRERLGVLQSSRDMFELLQAELPPSMKAMAGFRNIAAHEYQALQLPITDAIITQHLDDFLAFTSASLLHDKTGHG